MEAPEWICQVVFPKFSELPSYADSGQERQSWPSRGVQAKLRLNEDGSVHFKVIPPPASKIGVASTSVRVNTEPEGVCDSIRSVRVPIPAPIWKNGWGPPVENWTT